VLQVGRRRRVELMRVVVVEARTQVQHPLLAEADRVEHIGRLGAGGLAHIAGRIAAGDGMRGRPRIVRVGVGQVGAVVARSRAGGRAALVAGQRVVGACGGLAIGTAHVGDRVGAAYGLFAAVLHAGVEAVAQRAGLQLTGHAGLVDEAVGLRGARVGAAPDGAEQVRVALAVVRLGPQVIVAGIAVAGDVAQYDAAEIVRQVQGGDVRLGLLEVAVDQAVERIAVGHDRAAVAIECQVGAAGERVVVREAAGIGQVVGFHVVVADHHLGRAVEAERQ